ncbi:hypothetical protein Pla175_14560 [Pirellulimonas nuda]|uniref:Uncharacterized protein n=2 Tax=Pirellulimonas nuda TaxID=2528009 RepID=A0A518D9D5_9BACT|nr:hypothetical protein Pla175_14560 [Pirellulimonas nuda]
MESAVVSPILPGGVAMGGPLFEAPVVEESCGPEVIYAPPGQVAPPPIMIAPEPNCGPVVFPPQALPPGVLAAPAFDPAAPQGAISPGFGLPGVPAAAQGLPNPLPIPVGDEEHTWDELADVVSLYFPIVREQRVKMADGVLTEGLIETPYQTGATLLEPLRRDSVGSFNRWQSTLQTIRRRALVRVIPDGRGYLVKVEVEKQLEDLPAPVSASAGQAAFRNDPSLPSRITQQNGVVLPSAYWIDLGRDQPLEQAMLTEIAKRLAPATPALAAGGN